MADDTSTTLENSEGETAQRRAAFEKMLGDVLPEIIALDNIGYSLRNNPDELWISETSISVCVVALAQNLLDKLVDTTTNPKAWDHITSAHCHLGILQGFAATLRDEQLDWDSTALSGIGGGIERMVHLTMEELNAAARVEGLSAVQFEIAPGAFKLDEEQAA